MWRSPLAMPPTLARPRPFSYGAARNPHTKPPSPIRDRRSPA